MLYQDGGELMPIKEQLDVLFKQALKDNDVLTKNFIRQLRAKVGEHLLSKGMPRDSADEAIWKHVIGIYRKSIAKAVELMERRGAAGSELVKTYKFEIKFCDRFLPQLKSKDDVRDMVEAKVAQLGATSSSDVGRVVGAVMKDAEQGTVDGKLVKALAERLLSN